MRWLVIIFDITVNYLRENPKCNSSIALNNNIHKLCKKINLRFPNLMSYDISMYLIGLAASVPLHWWM